MRISPLPKISRGLKIHFDLPPSRSKLKYDNAFSKEYFKTY